MGAAGAMDTVCDCHVHAFGPLDRYPAKAERGYDPPTARPDAYREEARAAGIGRCVFVQPSIYGDDNSALLDALTDRECRDRGIATPSDGWNLKDLAGLHERGIRGLRLNLLSPGGNGPATIRNLAQPMKDLGWHVAALLDATQHGLLDDLLAHLDVPIVLDHFGRPPQGVVGSRPRGVRTVAARACGGPGLRQAVGGLPDLPRATALERRGAACRGANRGGARACALCQQLAEMWEPPVCRT